MSKKEKIDFKQLLQADVSTLFKKNPNKKLASKGTPKKSVQRKEFVIFDIGAKFINVVVAKPVKEKVVVSQNFSILTTMDALEDGRVLNEATLANTIKLALKEHGVKAKEAIITTNSSQVINREMIVNKVEPDEMDTVLRYEMQQYLPINLNDYLVRYTILEEFEENNQPKLKVYVISYPDRLGKSYYNLIKSIDLKPMALETSYISLNKLINQTKMVNSTPFDFTQTTAFLDMGASTIDVNIYKDKKIKMTRIIKAGGDNIDQLLSQRHQIQTKSALSIKSRLNLGEETQYTETELIYFDETVKIGVDQLVFEIDRIFQFYKNKSYSEIDKVYIYGGVSKLQGLEQYMTTKLGITVETITHMDSIEIKNSQEEASFNEFINTIGAAIRL